MEDKKYLSLSGLELYNDLLQESIAKLDSNILETAKAYSDGNLETAQTYADNAAATKSLVQIVTWEADD